MLASMFIPTVYAFGASPVDGYGGIPDFILMGAEDPLRHRGRELERDIHHSWLAPDFRQASAVLGEHPGRAESQHDPATSQRNRKAMFKLTVLSLVLAYLSSTPTQAAPQTLIISGGKDTGPTGREFYLDCEFIYLMERMRGIDPIVVAEDGTWKFVKNKERLFPAFGPENLIAAFELIQANLQPGEPVDIHISDHGAPADTGDDPWNGGFVLFQEAKDTPPWGVSHKELKYLIEKYIHPTSLVRLVGSYCFSGGLHHISFQLPNVCSTTLTDFLNPSVCVLHRSFDRSFWLEIGSKAAESPRSIFSAHWAAMPLDLLNEGRGSLSSMSYVDHILKCGPYGQAAPPVAACDAFLKTLASEEVSAILEKKPLKMDAAPTLESKSEGLITMPSIRPRHYVFVEPEAAATGEVRRESKEEKIVMPLLTSAGADDPWELLDPSDSAGSCAMVSIPGLSPSQAELLQFLQDDLRSAFATKGKACALLVKSLKEGLHAQEEAKATSSLPARFFNYLGTWASGTGAVDPSKDALVPFLYLQSKAESLRKTMVFLKSAKPEEINKYFNLLAHELTPMGTVKTGGTG
jgi:hypothetical protein